MNEFENYLRSHTIEELHPSEIANLLKDMDESNFEQALKLIPKESIADVTLELPDRYFGDIVESYTPKEIAKSLGELESDDQTDFMQDLEEHDKKVAKEVFGHLDEEDQADILHLKQYKEDEAGAYMQTELYTASFNDTVDDVIRDFSRLRREGELENIQYLFVVDENNILRYGVSLDNLLTFDCVRQRVEAGSLTIQGWYFDLHAGELLAFNPAEGMFRSVGQ